MKNKKMTFKINPFGIRAGIFIDGNLAIDFWLHDEIGVFEPIASNPEYEDLLLKDKDFQWRLESILLYLKSFREDYLKLMLRRSVIEDICEELLK